MVCLEVILARAKLVRKMVSNLLKESGYLFVPIYNVHHNDVVSINLPKFYLLSLMIAFHAAGILQ